MAEHPTVTTPGGTDIFAGLSSLDYSTFNDESMAMLVDDNLAAPLPSANASAPPPSAGGAALLKTGLTPGGMGGGMGGGNPYFMTPRTAGFMAELAADTPVHGHASSNGHTDPAAMLFDHDLVTSGLGGDDDDDEGDDALRQDDLPTPLTFSFTPTGGNGPASLGNPRYHVAAAHKHKRVRSNPDMLQNPGFLQMLGNQSSSLRPNVEAHSVSLPTTPLDGNGAAFEPMPAPLPIGVVNVVTPVAYSSEQSTEASDGQDAFPSDMDSFLKEMQWSELAENNNSMNVDTLGSLASSSAGYRSQRIQAGMNELKMKRKRPTQHMRHHSNPVDLLHNLDQFRLLSQQQHGGQPPPPQQQQLTPPPSPPMQFPSPTKLGGLMPIQQQQPLMQPQMQAALPPQMMAPTQFGMPPQGMMMQDMQFQVPSDIANGSARSLHSRTASMPSTAFSRGRGARARGGARGSTGLSMDLSQLNLEFLTLPEDQFQQRLQEQRQTQAYVHAMSGAYPSPSTAGPVHDFQQNSPPQGKKFMSNTAAAAAAEAESNRKSYKCGRCGQPKVGHVCTMPDLRNNWTQVDTDVTKGIKVVRVNCHIVATKNRWVPQHEDNL